MDLFSQQLNNDLSQQAPLADRMRPANFVEFIGQEKVIGPDTLLRQAIEQDELPSIIFWGPPGSGKTTLARLIAKETDSNFVPFSAVTAGVKQLREAIQTAEEKRKLQRQRTILFIDEIHRWNKAQQDALLPHIENGLITLIGATTENPSFEINSALLSRSRVFVLEQLTVKELIKIIEQALKNTERGLGKVKVEVDDQVIEYLASMSNGDARTVLNALEFAIQATSKNKRNVVLLEHKKIKEALQKTHLLYDRQGDEHYNIISALHKSLRGSDVDAALYWLGRMLEAGEDPLYVARRLVRFASEDIGLADPQALTQAVAAYQAAHFIGLPECNVILAQAVAYLAKAPKSNKLYVAYKKVQQDIHELPNEPVPLHIRNAPTKLMKDLEYGQGYKYNPNYDEPVEQDYLPEKFKGRKYLDE